MNSKEGQSALEIMLMVSLASKLHSLGAPQALAEKVVEDMDFNDVRAHLTRTEEDLKAQFPTLFK